jgi:hypothetical protein
VEQRPGAIGEVRFADLEDGWVVGSDLWATHDGGVHWDRVTLPGVGPNAGAVALETAAGVVHAVVFDTPEVRIYTSPVGRDAWQASPTTVPIGAGPVPRAQLVLQGTAGWVIEVDRTVVGGARLQHGRWSTWQPPCADAGGPAVLAASSPTDLVAVCDEGLWTGGPRGVRSHLSTDGGTTFHRTGAALPVQYGPQLASPVARTAVAAGSTPDGTPVLVATFDAGASWTTVARGPANGSWEDLGFTSASQGVVIEVGSDAQTAGLLMTLDGGHRWSPVPFQPAQP